MNDMISQGKKAGEHLSRLCGADCYLVLQGAEQEIRQIGGETGFCSRCANPRCQMFNTHLYGCHEAYRWGGKYIYYCPEGLVFVASSMLDERGMPLGGMVTGPVVMGHLQDTIHELGPQPDEEQIRRISHLPVFSTAEVNSLAEVQALLQAGLRGHRGEEELTYGQDEVLSFYGLKGLETARPGSKFLIEQEKKLIDCVHCGDKQEAGQIINELLYHMYFTEGLSYRDIKARTVELIVLLSRAAIEAGADINEILASNTDYIQRIEEFQNIEQLSLWLTVIVHRFVNYVFDFASVRHSDSIYKAMEYINGHYQEKIALEDVAKHVYLSKSYLSKLFKEETDKSIFEYINIVRIERGKEFLKDSRIKLIDVAGLCGFEDQSYFTKVFKRVTGVSPKKYRDSRLIEHE